MLTRKENLFILFLFLQSIDALAEGADSNDKKVRFFKVSEDSTYSSGGNDFTLTDKNKNRKSKFISAASSSVSTTGTGKKSPPTTQAAHLKAKITYQKKQPSASTTSSINPNIVIHRAKDKDVPVTKSILKNSSTKANSVNNGEEVVIFKRKASETEGISRKSQEKAFIISRYNPSEEAEEEDLNQNQNTGDPYRQIGPTPQYINDISPDRFWLPPNAPIQNSASFLPFLPGIAGANPIGNLGAQAQDANSPQIVGMTRPRDTGFIADPITADEIANQEFQTFLPLTPTVYSPPCELPPLNPITPIPGGNIVDPLSPQVQNINGPYYPYDPTNDGAYLITADVPEPQLVARNIDDGPYIVEPVVDPIVYFDPANNRTVIFDPQTNAVRLFDPEIDPELPPQQSPNTLTDRNDVNGGLLKVSRNNSNSPAFWIMKRRNGNGDNSGLEKAAKMTLQADNNINGQNTIIFETNLNIKQNGANGNGNSYQNQIQSQPGTKSNLNTNNGNGNNMNGNQNQPIQKSLDPIQNQQTNQQQQQQLQNPQVKRNGVAQVSSQELSPSNNSLEKRTSKDQQQLQNSVSTVTNPTPLVKKNNYVVTIVYRADTDFDLEKRYKGFKQNSSAHTTTINWKQSFATLSILVLISMFF